MSFFGGVKFWDELTSLFKGFTYRGVAPQICSEPYEQSISRGLIAGATPFSKIGYLPSLSAGVDTSVWSYGTTQPSYLFPTSAMQMELLSSNNTDDIGTVIHNGTSTGGSLTTLINTAENFLTTTAAGDCVVLDKSGTNPEFGYITSVDSNIQITVSGGFSRGGSGSGRAYSIIDESATSGGHAVEVTALDGNYAEIREIVILNGTTVVPTVGTSFYRINVFRVIAAGANKKPTGAITIRHISDTPVYSYISAGYTRARNGAYTVPAGKTLYINNYIGGYATTGSPNKEFARITSTMNIDPTTQFRSDNLFYPFTDIVIQNSMVTIEFKCPTKIPAKTDIRIIANATANGIVLCNYRGWIE